MNWLAHLYLSAPTPEFRLGNLLPDLIGPLSAEDLSPEVLRGVACHRSIDAFTDKHAIVRLSISRLPAPYRRFGGIIIDVVYDHFLAADWPSYAPKPLHHFVDEVFAAFDTIVSLVPSAARPHLRRIHRENLICSYATMPGIREALRRTGRRLRKPVDLGAVLAEVDMHTLKSDFGAFFPALQTHVAPFVASSSGMPLNRHA
jgi:acyl carrier protein phosphodiesterase